MHLAVLLCGTKLLSCCCAGRFFTFDVLDSHGGEIRAIAFNTEADRFEPVVAVGDIVEISKASLKPKRNTVRTVCPVKHPFPAAGC